MVLLLQKEGKSFDSRFKSSMQAFKYSEGSEFKVSPVASTEPQGPSIPRTFIEYDATILQMYPGGKKQKV